MEREPALDLLRAGLSGWSGHQRPDSVASYWAGYVAAIQFAITVLEAPGGEEEMTTPGFEWHGDWQQLTFPGMEGK
jgi:hypothetical protein